MLPIGRQRAPTGLHFLHNSNLINRGEKANKKAAYRTGAEEQGVSREEKAEGQDSKWLLKAPYKIETPSFYYKINEKQLRFEIWQLIDGK